MSRHLPLLLALGAGACVPADLALELDRARIERDQARLEADQARLAADKAMLEAERIRAGAQQQMNAQVVCKEPAAATPPPEPKTSVVQGRFRFDGKSAVVKVHVAGMGIDESFASDAKGRIAVLLPVGHYQVNLEAKGYRNKVITIDVPELAEGERFDFTAKLERDKK